MLFLGAALVVAARLIKEMGKQVYVCERGGGGEEEGGGHSNTQRHTHRHTDTHTLRRVERSNLCSQCTLVWLHLSSPFNLCVGINNFVLSTILPRL